MKNNIRKIFACIMAFVMLISIVPFAQATNETDVNENVSNYEHESNADGYCIYCGKDLDPVSHCDHICHKGGVQGFIYKFLRVIWMIFGKNQKCYCGMAHYGEQDDFDIGPCIERNEVPVDVATVVNEFNYVMNELIAKGTFTLRRLTDDKLSSNSNDAMINGLISNLMKPTDDTYIVKNGKVSDEICVGDIVSHADGECTLIPQGVSSASIVSVLDGYKVTIVLVSENYIYNNGVTVQRPVHHESCLSIPDYANMGDAITFKEVNAVYQGAVIEYTMDSFGRVTSLKTSNPFDLDMTSTVGNNNYPLSMTGYGIFNEVYFFTY